MTEATLFLPAALVGGKEITATFDGGQLSSDGGVLILREIDKGLGIATIMRLLGEIFRKSGLNWSPLPMLTKRVV